MDQSGKAEIKQIADDIWKLYERHKRQVRSRNFLLTVFSLMTWNVLCEERNHKFAGILKENDFSQVIAKMVQEGEFLRTEADKLLAELSASNRVFAQSHLHQALEHSFVALKSVNAIPDLIEQLCAILVHSAENHVRNNVFDVSNARLDWATALSAELLDVYERHRISEKPFRFSKTTHDLLVALAEKRDLPEPRQVFIPFAAAGELLIRFSERFGTKTHVFGLEHDEMWWSAGIMRLYFQRFETERFYCDAFLNVNLELSPNIPRTRACDLIVSIIPDEQNDGSHFLDTDLYRIFAGTIQGIFDQLSETGRAILLVPTRILGARSNFRRAQSDYEKWQSLLLGGNVETVISLPKMEVFGSHYSILMLNRYMKDKKTRNQSINMIHFEDINRRDLLIRPGIRQKFDAHNSQQVSASIQQHVMDFVHSKKQVIDMEWVDRYRNVLLANIQERSFSLHTRDYVGDNNQHLIETKTGMYRIEPVVDEADEQLSVELRQIAQLVRGYNLIDAIEKTDDDEVRTDIMQRHSSVMFLMMVEPEPETVRYKAINLSHMQAGQIEWQKLEDIEMTFKPNKETRQSFEEKYVVETGDLLLAIRGSVIKFAVMDEQLTEFEREQGRKVIFSSNFIRIRPFSKTWWLSQYLRLYFESPVGMFMLRALQQGTSQPVISSKELMKLKIPLIDKERGANIVKLAEDYETQYQAAVYRYRQSMNELFGKLSVDYTFEPIKK